MSRSLPVFTEQSPSAGVAPTLSRRTFLGATTATLLASLLVQSCGGGDPTGPGGNVEPPPIGSTAFSNGVLTLQLALIPALTGANGHQVIGISDGNRRADVVVINVNGTFRAFSSICTHEGCTVTGYSGQRMICPCHGSEYNQNGQPVAGPAPSALREFPVTLNTTAQTLAITV